MSSPSPSLSPLCRNNIETAGMPDPQDAPRESIMPPRNRSLGRDVHIYDAKDATAVLGGLILKKGVTNANFYSMVGIFVLFTGSFELRNEEDVKIEKNDDALRPGRYYIHARDSFSINNEPWLLRTISRATGTRVQSFIDAVRNRDGRCVVSEEVAEGAQFNAWAGFEATHIFPIAYEGHWKDHGYDRWVTIQPEEGGTINSVQNGMLLRSDIHQLFDTYELSINPDDKYKVVVFGHNGRRFAGKHLDQHFINDPQRPVDELLRWHFRQAVLANMRGAGEPRFEHDFPPGSDIVGDILQGPKAAERMEFELFTRLAAQVEVDDVSLL